MINAAGSPASAVARRPLGEGLLARRAVHRGASMSGTSMPCASSAARCALCKGLRATQEQAQCLVVRTFLDPLAQRLHVHRAEQRATTRIHHRDHDLHGARHVEHDSITCTATIGDLHELARTDRLHRRSVHRHDARVTYPSDLGVIAETDRVIIRPWRLHEADRLFDLLRRMEVVKWLGRVPKPMRDRDEALASIERWAASLAADPRFGAWAAVERSSGVAAGTVLLKPLPDGDGEIEIGWHFHPDSWGKGLASEAAGALLAHGFSEGLDEVWAVTHLDNQRSGAVCRRIGMRLLGVTHRWYHEPSLMFWAGAHDEQHPSFAPDEPADDRPRARS